MPYFLSEEAEDDLLEISIQGYERFGPHQAQRYQDELLRIFGLIATTPEMGKRSKEFSTDITQAYTHPHKPYLIVYKIHEDREVEILTLVPARTDWKKS